jgi:hypothetical protein
VGSGTEEPNSTTHAKNRDPCDTAAPNPDGPDDGNDPDPYAYIFKSDPNTGPVPYNCLAWALGHTDRWVWPVPSASWKKILDDYGYDPNAVVDCTNPCPPGKGPKIKLIFIEKTVGTVTIQKLVHAMKRQADGKWSSKNGQTSRWKDITDIDDFLDKHYSAPAGWTTVTKGFCKK